MTLGLDLGSSEAKLARAREHLAVLEAEVPTAVQQSSPYAIRFSPVDPQTGWCDIFLVPHERGKPRPGIVFGDVIHNLRSALDYIVTALVDAAQAKLTRRHQFPVFIDAAKFAQQVGTAPGAVKNGPLHGIIDGFALVEQLQPYHRKPDPRHDPLWHVHRFSNADKHREPATQANVPGGSIQIAFEGIKVDEEVVLEIPTWSPDEEYLIKRIRFNPPIARNLHVTSPIEVVPHFTTPAFDGEPEDAIGLVTLRKACDYVAMVVDAFKLL